jgi:hypothetical protein
MELALTAILMESCRAAISFLLFDLPSATQSSEASIGRTAAMAGKEITNCRAGLSCFELDELVAFHAQIVRSAATPIH